MTLSSKFLKTLKINFSIVWLNEPQAFQSKDLRIVVTATVVNLLTRIQSI